MTKGKPKLPRAPLPKQTGGAHRTRRHEPHRKRKHKGREFSDRIDAAVRYWKCE